MRTSNLGGIPAPVEKKHRGITEVLVGLVRRAQNKVLNIDSSLGTGFTVFKKDTDPAQGTFFCVK